MRGAVSRSEFEKRIKPYDTEDGMDKALYNFAHNILISCPSVRPTLASCEDTISRKAAMQCCRSKWEEGVEERLEALPSVQPQTVGWDAMIEEVKEETITMVDAEDDTLDVKYGLFEEDILEIINRHRMSGKTG